MREAPARLRSDLGTGDINSGNQFLHRGFSWEPAFQQSLSGCPAGWNPPHQCSSKCRIKPVGESQGACSYKLHVRWGKSNGITHLWELQSKKLVGKRLCSTGEIWDQLSSILRPGGFFHGSIITCPKEPHSRAKANTITLLPSATAFENWQQPA